MISYLLNFPYDDVWSLLEDVSLTYYTYSSLMQTFINPLALLMWLGFGLFIFMLLVMVIIKVI